MGQGGRELLALLRQPTWRRWTLASFLARLPATMTLLGLVLLGRQVGGSVAAGALLSGAAMLAAGGSALWRGRMLDRAELGRGLRRDALLTATVLLAIAAAAAGGAPFGALLGLALAQGVAMAALTGGFRALLPAVVAREDLPRANAVEAVAAEIAFVAGPALAGILALLVGPEGVLVAMAASAIAAALLTLVLPTLPPAEARPSGMPWQIPGVAPILGLVFVVAVGVGAVEALTPAHVEGFGADPALAGPLLALLALGSGLGGLVASLRVDALTGEARPAGWLLLALAALVAPIAMTAGPVGLGVLLLAAGAPIAPLNALGTIRLQRIVPPGRHAEGFSLYLAAIMLGAGLGQSAVGAALPALGSGPLFLLAAALPLLAATMVGLRRGVRPRLVAEDAAR